MMGTNDSSGVCNMPPSSTPDFAFLLLKEHPYGREMLSQLLSENFIPSIVISEDSSIGDEEREKFLKRIDGNPVASTIESQIAKLSEEGFVVPHIEVDKHNSPNVMPHIEDLDLDLIVFGGTRTVSYTHLTLPTKRIV